MHRNRLKTKSNFFKSIIRHLSLIWVIIFFLFFSSAQAYIKKGHQPFTAKSALLVDCNNNKIIFSTNKHLRLECASTVKLLTALVALEKIGTDTAVRISSNSYNVEPTKAGLTKDAYYSSGDLITIAVVASSNDACLALAEAVAGSESKFAELMNEKAKQLGALNSNFVDPCGLPARDQYSNVYDLYLITRAALKNSFIKTALAQKYVVIKGSDGRSIKLVNHNKLLFRWSWPVVLGKTGYTIKAGHCYAGIVYGKERQYALVILGSRKPWKDISYIISRYAKLKILKS